MPVVPTFTPNLNLIKLPPNYKVWAQLMNDNLTLIDAAISSFISFNNLQGAWANSTAYVIGDTVVDTDLAIVFTCQVDHVSALLPTTFLQDRTNNPTYWTVTAAPAANRGAWQPSTAYSRNDFVLADGTKYAMCLVSNTSGATFAADLALGFWTVLVDLSAVGSLVLPVLSGLTDANKVVMTDGLGTNYLINTVTQLLNLFTRTGAGTTIVMDDSPTLINNPVAPTQSLENNSTRIATTAYADTTLRAVIPRVQTFTASGTYTPHAKMLYCTIEAWGGGGGGGGTAAPGTGNIIAGAGGGGAGGYSRLTATAATIGVSQVVTIGAAGAGGAAGNNAGGNGGDTSVGALCIAKGGSGGLGSSGNPGSHGGLGGIAGTGDITGTGQAGFAGVGINIINTVTMATGGGGSSSIGGGARSRTTGSGGSVTGTAGSGFASGGEGGTTGNGAAAAAGGPGTAGFVIITEFCYA